MKGDEGSTSVQRGNETPIARPYLCRLRAPPFLPFDSVTVWTALLLRPEAEVQRRDEEYPVEH